MDSRTQHQLPVSGKRIQATVDGLVGLISRTRGGLHDMRLHLAEAFGFVTREEHEKLLDRVDRLEGKIRQLSRQLREVE